MPRRELIVPLERLRVRNFQKLEHLDLEFDPRVTVLAGPSGSGKSSALRALKWLLTNRPAGDAFQRHGADEVEVMLGLDGHEVVRRRSGSENLYVLDGQVFSAIGNSVPEEISRILNVGSLNFSGQHDAPFLFSRSPGEVGKELNSVVNLGLIDRVMAELASEARKARTATEVCQDRLAGARTRQEALGWVEEAEAGLKALESREMALGALEGRLERLQELISVAERLEIVVKDGQEAFQEGEVLVKRVQEFRSGQTDLNRLQGLVDIAAKADWDRRQAEHRLQESEKRLLRESGGRCPLCQSPMSTSRRASG